MFRRGAHAAYWFGYCQPVDGAAPEGTNRAAAATGAVAVAVAEQCLTPESNACHVENSAGTKGADNDHRITVGRCEQCRCSRLHSNSPGTPQ